MGLSGCRAGATSQIPIVEAPLFLREVRFTFLSGTLPHAAFPPRGDFKNCPARPSKSGRAVALPTHSHFLPVSGRNLFSRCFTPRAAELWPVTVREIGYFSITCAPCSLVLVVSMKEYLPPCPE